MLLGRLVVLFFSKCFRDFFLAIFNTQIQSDVADAQAIIKVSRSSATVASMVVSM